MVKILAQSDINYSPNLQLWFISGPYLPPPPWEPGKSKIMAITKISLKTASLGLSNGITSRSRKNHRILIKLIKPTQFLGTKNFPPGAGPNGQHKILTEAIIRLSIRSFRIHKSELHGVFRIHLFFLLRDPNEPNLGEFWTITPVMNV